jgi:hypothetical protein
MLSFLLRKYRRRVYKEVREFIISMDKLYAFAAEIYKKNLSTTKRPFYIARPRFLFIHLVDPHLLCIPSLHVLVVIFTYKKFSEILRSLSNDESIAAMTEEMKQGALLISWAILFVKQHSINCIATTLYAMTRFDTALFSPEDGEAFIDLFFNFMNNIVKNKKFTPKKTHRQKLANHKVRPGSAPVVMLPAEDTAEIKSHIRNLYRQFISAGKTAKSWDEPLLCFMQQMPCN